VGLLAAAGVLRQNTVILHGTGLRRDDLPRLAAARASVVWCPEADRRLYGSTAPVRELLAAGVRVGLGSDSAAAGSRDALSNLAVARGEGIVADDELLRLATEGSGEVARMPVGGFAPGAPADFVLARGPAELVTGARTAVELVVVRGEPLYGNPEYLRAAGVKSQPIRVDGAPRALEASLCRRLRAILRDHPRAAEASWVRGLDFPRWERGEDAV
jgi:cytosine/adenosine deaminase-related metal-dependent hydrolase